MVLSNCMLWTRKRKGIIPLIVLHCGHQSEENPRIRADVQPTISEVNKKAWQLDLPKI